MKVIIVHAESFQANKHLILPYLGKILFDANCESEIEDAESAQLLADLNIGISIKQVEKTVVKQKAKNDSIAEDEMNNGKEENSANDTQETNENQELIDHVNGMKTLAELKTLAAESGLDEEEWKKIKAIKKLQEYIISKLTA